MPNVKKIRSLNLPGTTWASSGPLRDDLYLYLSFEEHFKQQFKLMPFDKDSNADLTVGPCHCVVLLPTALELDTTEQRRISCRRLPGYVDHN